ncbi:hypothetical protein G3I19_24290 [Streptomyces sp. SID10853]|uniref:hypothetical protein n=1 Tax=Streptomyces sp. SID10853 TaxID=2706028 RepID=UPI0013C1DD88|nr:hypothetical protein [Streptomyces sp. SID10853]NDZ81593.1 hypothetical protein [Streptomyces sp. SID10853]
MTSDTYGDPGAVRGHGLRRNKVPGVTVYFWVIKVLCTTVGETDRQPGVPLQDTTAVFAVVLAVVFVAWFRAERTLSIHSIDTAGREAVWSFWIAYVLTRPLEASMGDCLSQPTGDGGPSPGQSDDPPRPRSRNREHSQRSLTAPPSAITVCPVM